MTRKESQMKEQSLPVLCTRRGNPFDPDREVSAPARLLELRVIPLVVQEGARQHHGATKQSVLQSQSHGVPR